MDRRKGGGPKTAVGRQRVSSNALKHGATSSRFISEAEKARFDKVIHDLQEHYQSTNPLVHLQLERIARITIQLERIQNTIDAIFLISRARSSTYEMLMESLKMDQREQSMAASSFSGLDKEVRSELVDNDKIDVSKELIKSLTPFPRNSQEFLDRCPLLCRHLYDKALEKSMTVSDYIDQELPSIDNASEKRSILVRALTHLNGKGENAIERDYEDEIMATEYRKLKNAAIWYVGELQRTTSTIQKIDDFKELLPAQEQATIPDLDQLDKLMRYQTTLQRQLSTAIGELLILTK